MDPFLTLKYNKIELKTDELLNAGKRPKWNKIFDIEVKSISDNFLIEVYDVDVFGNELIGAGIAKGRALCKGSQINWFPISYQGKEAGKVLISS
jgi:Ca2+-dependent lipid-binding protein